MRTFLCALGTLLAPACSTVAQTDVSLHGANLSVVRSDRVVSWWELGPALQPCPGCELDWEVDGESGGYGDKVPEELNRSDPPGNPLNVILTLDEGSVSNEFDGLCHIVGGSCVEDQPCDVTISYNVRNIEPGYDVWANGNLYQDGDENSTIDFEMANPACGGSEEFIVLIIASGAEARTSEPSVFNAIDSISITIACDGCATVGG